MAAKKNKIDGISLSIVILNILIVMVLLTLVVLIYLYFTGKLEPTDVANMDQKASEGAAMSTTPISTVIPETEPDTSDTGEADTTPEETGEPGETEDTTSDNSTVPAVETDEYDEAFFENDLFIGDSIYTGLTGYEFLPDKNVFAKMGLTPESGRSEENGKVDGVTAVAKAKKMKPKRIFIMLGTNGLAYLGNTYMTEQMKLFIEDLKEASPESYIYVVAIPPVTKEHASQGKQPIVMVNGYNKLLRSMCEPIGVVFLDLCSKLQDSSGYFDANYAEADGLHFKPAAYKRMLSFFQKSIKLN